MGAWKVVTPIPECVFLQPLVTVIIQDDSCSFGCGTSNQLRIKLIVTE